MYIYIYIHTHINQTPRSSAGSRTACGALGKIFHPHPYFPRFCKNKLCLKHCFLFYQTEFFRPWEK